MSSVLTRHRPWRATPAWLAGLAVLYTGLAFLGIQLTREFGSVAPLWPAGGLLLGILLRLPDRWWQIFAVCIPGSMAADILAGCDSIPVALGLAVANLLGVWPAVWLVHRHLGLPFTLDGLRPLLRLALIILLAPLPGAMWGAAVVHWAYATPFPEIFQVWWWSDSVGAMIVTPLVLTWPRRGLPRMNPWQWLELGTLLLTTATVSYLAFELDHPILLHMVMPPLLWAALRFGIGGTALAGLLVTAISLQCTVEGTAPFSASNASLGQRVLDLQLYLGALLAPALLVAATFVDRCRALRALAASEARFRDFADTAADVFWEVDPMLRFSYISGRFQEVLGLAPRDLLGKDMNDFLQHRSVRATGLSASTDQQPGLDADTPEGHRDRQFQFTRPDGLIRVLRDSAKPVFDDDNEFLGYRGAISDITETQRMYEQIAFQATHDGLTGLPNRTLYRSLLRESLARAKRGHGLVGVLFLDLDGFKPVNDSLGHAVGDLLLQTVAKRLKTTVRDSDVVARLGGDEFVVLLSDLETTQGAAEVARKLVAVLSEPYRVPTVDHPLYLSASIGISLYPQDGEDVETLLKNADIAMYQAKVQGRNGYRFFSTEMHTRALSDLTLSNELRQALDRGEFVLYYQPRVCLRDDRLLGVEALIRWQHPRRGLLSPGEFIPLAELTGVIDPLSRWVVESACEQGRRWLAEGLPRFQIAVNLSARQFRERHLPAFIEAARGSGDQTHLALEVELTESMVMQNPAQALEVMRELKRLGVQMAIDDFGTGYSSLAQLRHFPIDCLKIDKSFVERLPGDAEDRAIIQAIIALGQSLHLRLVAEGVETPEQHQYLARMGCHEGQGYLFGRPMPAAALVAWLADRQVVSPDSR